MSLAIHLDFLSFFPRVTTVIGRDFTQKPGSILTTVMSIL
jgi:hypothetical protein